jgi:murein DD-endopeptidase MepM/ murein hydrolase activator NlpD
MQSTLLSIALLVLASGALVAGKPSVAGDYRVRQGDTAARIAKEHGLSVAQLQVLNPGVRLAKLSIGQAVHVTKAAMAAKSAIAAARKTVPRVTTEVVHRDSMPVPTPALPPTPGLGPSVLVHLERVLPAQTRLTPPDSLPAAALMDLRNQDGAYLANQLQQVVPSVDNDLARARTLPFEPADPEHLDLLWPVETRTISSSWGPRMRTKVVKVKQGAKRKRVRYRGSHKGVDLTAPVGTNVYSTMDGEIAAVGRHRQYGNFVVVDHGNGVSTLYAHHKANFVQEGDIVRRGQKIAEVGRTGNATGPHLHFELRLHGQKTNPLPLLNDVEEVSGELLAQNAAAIAPSRR